MAAGSFTEIYSTPDQKEQWHGIVTCFFMDTAPVVIDYIETIWHMLKPGAVWVNLGPLLYHWVADVDNNADERYAQSLEVRTATGTIPPLSLSRFYCSLTPFLSCSSIFSFRMKN